MRRRLAELRAALRVERNTPDRNACYAREIEQEIESILARLQRSEAKE